MAKRILLFLVTNALVVVMASLIMNLVLPLFGVNLQSEMGVLLVFCAVFGMTGAFVSLAISRWVAKKLMGVQLVDPANGGVERQLHQMVEQLARSAGIPMPEVGIFQAPDPNAFATGPTKKRSLIAFSTGLLQLMDEREIRAVAAHEVSHIANGDMVTMTLLTGIANAFVMFLARLIAMAIENFLDEGLGFIGYLIVVFVLESLFMLLASIPLAAYSRWREYRADAGAARLTDRRAMASALRRLQEATAKQKRDGFSMAKISSHTKASLWATHPPLEKRMARLLAE